MKTFSWRFDLSKTCTAIVLVNLSVLSLALARADTAAYWRHEGTAGQFVAQGPDSVLDSSVSGNHMQTFNTTTAATYSPLVSPLDLRSGLPNITSLDFGPNPSIGSDDGGGKNDDNYTQDKLIQTQLFTALTVELAFNMNSIDGYQSLFGRDGKPLGDSPGEPDSPVSPLQIKIRGDDFPDAIPNQLFVEWIDGDGDIHFLSGGETIVAGEWKHIAFTLTATSAELWVAGETGDYVLKDAISGEDFAGSLGPGEVMIFDPTPFSIGRGMYNNGVADWSDALIDEVRVSDTALTPNDFLFLTEPGGVTGDFDGNGVVTGRDFLAWQRNPSLGNLSDWQNAYPGALAGFASVPEPASLVLVCGLLGVVASQRRRK